MNDQILLYHYTTQQGLISIIENKEIWMTNLHYLNDATEFLYSMDMYKDCIKRYIAMVSRGKADENSDSNTKKMVEELSGAWGDFPKGKKFNEIFDKFVDDISTVMDDLNRKVSIYVCAFSEKGDNLGQWMAYSNKGIGFSLGFNKSHLDRIAQEQKYALKKCIYNPIDQEREIFNLINEAYSKVRQSELTLRDIAPTMKDPSFVQEEEWRLICDTAKVDRNAEAFRPGISMIVPYIKFSFKKELPLKKVFVGPTPHTLLSKQSVQSLLLSNGIEGVDVENSRVPYRAW